MAIRERFNFAGDTVTQAQVKQGHEKGLSKYNPTFGSLLEKIQSAVSAIPGFKGFQLVAKAGENQYFGIQSAQKLYARYNHQPDWKSVNVNEAIAFAKQKIKELDVKAVSVPGSAEPAPDDVAIGAFVSATTGTATASTGALPALKPVATPPSLKDVQPERIPEKFEKEHVDAYEEVKEGRLSTTGYDIEHTFALVGMMVLQMKEDKTAGKKGASEELLEVAKNIKKDEKIRSKCSQALENPHLLGNLQNQAKEVMGKYFPNYKGSEYDLGPSLEAVKQLLAK